MRPARSGAGDETRTRIVDAALETLRDAGIVGTSARAIAQRGGFSQASIFYHFGSVNDVLIEAVERLSRERIDRYADRLRKVATLPELARVATELHAEDARDGHSAVLAQMLAGATSSDELSGRLLDVFTPWLELVEEVLERVASSSPYGSMAPVRDLSFAVLALFMGIELLGGLGGGRERADGLFETVQMAALLLDQLIAEPATAPGDDGPTPHSA